MSLRRVRGTAARLSLTYHNVIICRASVAVGTETPTAVRLIAGKFVMPYQIAPAVHSSHPHVARMAYQSVDRNASSTLHRAVREHDGRGVPDGAVRRVGRRRGRMEVNGLEKIRSEIWLGLGSGGVENFHVRKLALAAAMRAVEPFLAAYAHELAEKQRDRLAAGLHMPGYARVLCNNGQSEPMGSTHLIDGIDPEMNGVNRPAREALDELRNREPWKVSSGTPDAG